MAGRLNTYKVETKSVIPIEALPPKLKQESAANLHNSASNSAVANNQVEKALEHILKNVKDYINELPTEVASLAAEFSDELIEMTIRYRAQAIDSPISVIHTKTHPSDVFELWHKLGKSSYNTYEIEGNTSSILKMPYLEKLVSTIEQIMANEKQ